MHRHGALLVFDEVMSGSALRGGAQRTLRHPPRLTCLGKIIGGGLPVGAYGGRADMMDWSRPRVLCTRRAHCRAIRSR